MGPVPTALALDLVEDAWQRPVVLYVDDDWETIYPTRDSGSRAIWQLTSPRRPAYDTRGSGNSMGTAASTASPVAWTST